MAGHPPLSCKRDQIEMRDYMDKRVTPPKRVTSPTWGPPPPCKQAINVKTIQYNAIHKFVGVLDNPRLRYRDVGYI